jgi:PKD repeat protein
VRKNGDSTPFATGDTGVITFTPDDEGVYEVTLTASDEDGGSRNTTHTVTVSNVAATLSITGAANSNEGTVYTLALSAYDPGADTISSWTIDWGDGSEPQVIAGNPSAVAHTFVDNGTFVISATASDEDGSYAAGNIVTVAVANVAPGLQISGAATVREGNTYTLNLGHSEPGADTLQKWFINWGDGSAPEEVSGATTSVTHVFADGAALGTSRAITASAVDEDGSYLANSLNITVTNAAPALSIASLTNSALDVGTFENQAVIVSVAFSDPGFDTETFNLSRIDWGDGTPVSPATISNFLDGSAGNLTTGKASGTHSYAAGGVYTITIFITDDDGGETALQTHAIIAGVGLHNGSLVIIGTNLKDDLKVTKKQGLIVVKGTLGGIQLSRTFEATMVNSFAALLFAGNDDFSVENKAGLWVFADGGDGADRLTAEAGTAIFRGGAGADQLEGSASADWLDGGDGNDVIFGYGGDDYLEGGGGGDQLTGGIGSDILDGGAPANTLDGGGGTDLLVYQSGDTRLGAKDDLLTTDSAVALAAAVERFQSGSGWTVLTASLDFIRTLCSRAS